MTDILVEADRASRTYKRGATAVEAVVAASCRVEAGSRIAVMGPSGSGKTTLLRLMARLDAPTAGSLTWPGLRAGEPLRPAQIGVVFQTASLIPALTSVENVELPILLAEERAGVCRDPPRHRALAALAACGVEPMADKLPEQLSGGQAQRVALARAMAAQPRMILADEPTGQLDRAGALWLIDRLLDWADRAHAALVVATHDAAVAERMRSVWHMDHGRLEAHE